MQIFCAAGKEFYLGLALNHAAERNFARWIFSELESPSSGTDKYFPL
jgi:hypothetical protein